MNVKLRHDCKLQAYHLAVLAAFVLSACTIAHSQDTCPWMNEATASDLLGADVNGAVAGGPADSLSCTFTGRTGQGERTLQITVGVASDAHAEYLISLKRSCHSAKQNLNAIGNEAVTCPILHRKLVMGERAVGRVRNEVFFISIGTSIQNDPILTPAMLAMKIDAATEQVAGNLF